MAASSRLPRLTSWLATIACGLSMLSALTLAFRPQATADLGYHLAYGEALLDGRGVTTDAYLVHPPPSIDELAGELPPGAWIDADGDYRFVNANWLSQAIIAALHRLGGGAGLTLLGVALVAALLLSQGVTLRALDLGRGWIALVWLTTTLCAWERFNVRPELFGYVCLGAQLALLAGRVTWPRIAALAALQVLAANLHGYWLLGLGVCGALALEATLTWLWRRRRSPARTDRDRAARLALATALLALAPALHPQGTRNLTLPIETVEFLQREGITGAGIADVVAFQGGAPVHPWALLGEFHATFDVAFAEHPATWWFLGLVVAALVAGIGLLAGGRLGWALIAAAMVLVGASMRRNLAPAALLLAPAAALGLATISRWVGRRFSDGATTPAHVARAVVLVAVAASALTTIEATYSNRLYLARSWPFRFGAGTSGVMVPRATFAWLDQRLDGPVTAFADQNIASNLVHFSSRVQAVPLLSNTWATPVARMRGNLALSGGRAPWQDAFGAAGWELAVLDTGSIGGPLISRLQRSDDWALVAVEPRLVVFARRGREATTRLIEDDEIGPDGYDVAALLERSSAIDPTSAAYSHARATLNALRWTGHLATLEATPMEEQP